MSIEQMPNLEIGHESVEKRQPDYILFRSISGVDRKTEHPAIIGDPDPEKNIWKSSDIVRVSLAGDEEEMIFDDYLRLIGISYGQYFKFSKTLADKGKVNQHEVLKAAHQSIINKRTEIAINKSRRFTAEEARRDNLQQETAKDHSLLFAKIINELGINGMRVRPATSRDDYLEGIDEFLELDPASLQSDGKESGHKYYFGIQRSFSNKHGEVAADPIRFIPEETEKGLVFRVFLKEELSEYVEGYGYHDQVSRWQMLLDARTTKAREAGMSPRQYAQTQPNFGLPPVSTVLAGGKKEQRQKAMEVLLAAKDQLNAFLEGDSASEKSQRVRFILERYRQDARIEDFIAALGGRASSEKAA